VTEARHWYADGLDPEEFAFQRLYGPWAPASPDEARVLFDATGVTWWIAGGWSIEAFTGVPRKHEDIDVSMWRHDLPALLSTVEGEYHAWAAGAAGLTPLTPLETGDPRPMPDTADQVWLRKHALSPWEYDVVLNPIRDGRWVFRRDPSLDFDLDEVTWVAPDGIRYVTPEMSLAYKAKSARAKDQRDFDATVPLLSTRQRSWLGEMIAHLHPGHPWLDRIMV
jgi:hypothetical protein